MSYNTVATELATPSIRSRSFSKRKHWGELNEGEVPAKSELKASATLSAETKLEHLRRLQAPRIPRINKRYTIVTLLNLPST